MARSTTITITAKFNGRCNCSATIRRGDRVAWQRIAGIVGCAACRLSTTWRRSVTVDGVSLTVVAKATRGNGVSRYAVNVNTCELTGNGAIHLDASGKVIGIGASSPMVRGDLCDYIGHAQRAIDEAHRPTTAQCDAALEADRALRSRGFELACHRGPNYR